MNALGRKKVVLLGMMSQMPVAGHVWLIVQFLIGFERLGYDAYYVEAHGCTPREWMKNSKDNGWEAAAGYIAAVLKRFDLADRWAYHAVGASGKCFGMSKLRLSELYRSAALLINLHGGTVPLPEHYATGRLVYLGTDPVLVEIRLHENDRTTVDLLTPHCAFFTWGLNYGNADCRLPMSDRFHFRPSRPPVVPEFWQGSGPGGGTFTTVGNWRQRHDVWFQKEVFRWSKHHEFLKYLDVPARTGKSFELALGRYHQADQQLLEKNGWGVRPASELSKDLDIYRQYLAQSRGEFTVAKEQNVHFRSGWFSERSAQYLATGRPVVTQETGFSNILPTGKGLFAFSSLEEVLVAIETINADYEEHCRAARSLAHEYFSYQVTLKQLLADIGL
jgi:hypothetical protein